MLIFIWNFIWFFRGNNASIKVLHSPDDRNRILKKILTHFNVKVQNMETKSFMKIFGLEIKSFNTNNNAHY
jgi:hypothetical protein